MRPSVNGLLRSDQCISLPLSTIGGKAEGLVRLTAAGATVPPWVVVPANSQPDSPADIEPTRMAYDALFDALSDEQGDGVMVRSSSPNEDGRHQSHAGEFLSLVVTDRADLAAAIAQVSESARNAPVSESRPATKIPVIVQRRVVPTFGGVLFSAHPVQGRPDEALIEVVQGGVGPLVDGSTTPARLSVDVMTGQRRRPDGVNTDRCDAPLCAELVRLLRAVERQFDDLVDIEWAVDDRGLWLLQARPQTRFALDEKLLPHTCHTSWFFDQRFRAPVSDFTRSTLMPLVLQTAVREPLAMLGDPLNVRVHYHAGIPYVPHEAYRRLLSGAPSTMLKGEFSALMMTACHCRDDASTSGSLNTRFGAATSALATLWAARDYVWRNDAQWRSLRDEIEGLLQQFNGLDAADVDGFAVRWAAADAWTLRFLRVHRWSLLLATVAFEAAQKAARFLPARTRDNLFQQLARTPQLRTSAANRAYQRAHAPNAHPAARTELVAHYGHRSESIDYAVSTWGERIRADALTTDVAWRGVAAQPDEGSEPESGMDPALDGHSMAPPVPIWLRGLIRLLEMREEQRFEWERVLERQRCMALTAAKQLVNRGLLSRADDVWLLTFSEFLDAMRNGVVNADVINQRYHGHLVERRTLSPRFIGTRAASPAVSTDANAWRGVGASPGTACGTAVVWLDAVGVPGPFSPGSVLVARSLDPAMTVYLSQVSAVVLERGGLLSHAAIVARELGIPVVVEIHDATRIIPDGLAVCVDGTSGLVTPVPLHVSS